MEVKIKMGSSKSHSVFVLNVYVYTVIYFALSNCDILPTPFCIKFKDKVIKDTNHLSKTHFSLMFIYKHLCKSQCMALVLSQSSIMQKLNSLVIYNADNENQS